MVSVWLLSGCCCCCWVGVRGEGGNEKEKLRFLQLFPEGMGRLPFNKKVEKKKKQAPSFSLCLVQPSSSSFFLSCPSQCQTPSSSSCLLTTMQRCEKKEALQGKDKLLPTKTLGQVFFSPPPLIFPSCSKS